MRKSFVVVIVVLALFTVTAYLNAQDQENEDGHVVIIGVEDSDHKCRWEYDGYIATGLTTKRNGGPNDPFWAVTCQGSIISPEDVDIQETIKIISTDENPLGTCWFKPSNWVTNNWQIVYTSGEKSQVVCRDTKDSPYPYPGEQTPTPNPYPPYPPPQTPTSLPDPYPYPYPPAPTNTPVPTATSDPYPYPPLPTNTPAPPSGPFTVLVDAQNNALISGNEQYVNYSNEGPDTVAANGSLYNSPELEFDSVILRYHDADAGYTRLALVSDGETMAITPSGDSLRIQAFVVDTADGMSDNSGSMNLTFFDPGGTLQVIVFADVHVIPSGNEETIVLPNEGSYTVTANGSLHNSSDLEFDSVILRYHDADAGYTRFALVSDGETITITPSGDSLGVQAFVIDTANGISDNTGSMQLTFEQVP